MLHTLADGKVPQSAGTNPKDLTKPDTFSLAQAASPAKGT